MGTVPNYERLRNGLWNERHLNTVPAPKLSSFVISICKIKVIKATWLVWEGEYKVNRKIPDRVNI